MLRREAVRLGKEVAQALEEGRPVVALESSVTVQGLPPPHNQQSARACANAIRESGVVPAITGVVAGDPVAGLTEEEIERLLDPKNKARKVGNRDLAVARAFGYWGATTVSGTCTIAHAAGIRVFATGGIGGVHREAEQTFDVSQDLLAIARSRVAVVTAGAKAILDLPRTLEALETLGVPVVGYGTSEFPAFYMNNSGLSLEYSVANPDEAARLLRARWEELGQEGGVIFANPIKAEAEARPEEISEAIEAALRDAKDRGIKGKAVTPFLLAEVARRTGGGSLHANLALLESNARVAGQIAQALAMARRP
ncbi:MAG: pseudouridine-5'-phosphate glycosidase [Myxococcales bacterium]